MNALRPRRALARGVLLPATLVLASLGTEGSFAHTPLPFQGEVTGGAAVLWEADIKTDIPLHEDQGLVASAGDRVFLATVGFGNSPELNVTAYDAVTSALVWSAEAPLAPNNPLLEAFVVSPDGTRLYVLVEDGLSVALLFGLDAANGAQLFSQSYQAAEGAARLFALAVSPDGTRVYSCGGVGYIPFVAHPQFVTVAFDAAGGQVLWEDFYDGNPGSPENFDQAVDVAVSPDGAQVFVTGTSEGTVGGTGVDYLTIAYASATGGRQWIARYSSGPSTNESAGNVSVSPDGSSLLVTGNAEQGDEIVSYAASTGIVQWTGTLESTSNVFPSKAVFSPDGSAAYLHARVETDESTDTDVRVARVATADGAVAWTYDYSTPLTGDWTWARPHGLVLTPLGGRAFVSIESMLGPSGGFEAVTLALRASDGALEWSAHDTFGIPGGIMAEGIALTDDGKRVATVARSQYPAPLHQLLFARAAATGTPLWLVQAGGEGPGNERARSVAAAPDGSSSALAVITDGYGPASFDLTVFDAGGATLWIRRDDQTTVNVSLADVAYSPDGGTVFASHYSLLDQLLLVEAFDAATGAELWSTELPGVDLEYELFHELAVDRATGRVFVVSSELGHFATSALDPVTGFVIWQQTAGPGAASEAHGIALAPDGARVFVTGTAVLAPAQESDMVTVAYDAATGALLWTASYAALGGPSEQEGTDIAVSADGSSVAVVGRSADPQSGVAAVYAAVSGAQIWSTVFSALSSPVHGAVEAVAANDSSLFALVSTSSPTSDLRVLAFDLVSGVPQWETAYDQGQDDTGNALVLEGDGTTLFATGQSDAGGSSLTLTLALDAFTGEILWSATHDGGALEEGTALALDAAGHVLYTASTQDGGATLDDSHVAAFAVPSLVGQPGAFSASAGGGQELFLRADAHLAGDVFLIGGSFSGTTPGFDFQGVHVPLNPDWYLPVSINAAMSPVVGGFGLLDAEAQAKALVAVPPGVALTLVGLTVAHAYGVADPLTGTAEFASNPVPLAIVP